MTALKKAIGLRLSIFSLALLLSLLFAKTVDAAEPCTDPAGCPLTTDNYNAAKHADFTIDNLIENVAPCKLIGSSFISGEQCIRRDPTTGRPMAFNSLPTGGALGGVNSLILAMYNNPPVSTYIYLADFMENIGAAPKTALAQGITGKGQGVLRPILELWKLSRNVAYLAFIVIFMVVGLMVMFRHRINAQTVVTAQMALPGLIVGLILVTFSYFIAALIVDLSFVTIKLVASLFIMSETLGTSPAQQAQVNQLADAPFYSLFGHYISSVWITPLRVFAGLFRLSPEASQAVGGSLISVITTPLGPAAWGASLVLPHLPGINTYTRLIGQTASQTLGAVIGGVLALIIIIALLIQMVRLVWKLIQGYIAILVATVTGPLIILQSSIPGRGATLGNWWKGLLANVLVFPAVFAAFLFSMVLIGTNSASFAEGDPLPLFTGIPAELLRLILGFGVVLMIPAIPDQVKAAFGIKGGGLGAMTGTEAGTALGGVGAAAGLGWRKGLEVSGLGGAVKRYQEQQAAERAGKFVAAGPAVPKWDTDPITGTRAFTGMEAQPLVPKTRLVKWLSKLGGGK